MIPATKVKNHGSKCWWCYMLFFFYPSGRNNTVFTIKLLQNFLNVRYGDKETVDFSSSR